MRILQSSLLVALFMLSLLGQTSGQSVSFVQSNMLDDYEFDIIKPIDGRIVSFNYAAPHGAFGYRRNYKNTFIVGHDMQMKELYSHPVEELAGNKYLAAVALSQRLQVYYADGKEIFTYPINPKSGKATEKPVALFTMSKKPSKAFQGFSSDSSYFFVAFNPVTDYKNELFEGVIMNAQSQVQTKFSLPLKKLKSYIDKTDFILSNEGTLYIVNKIRTKSAKNDYRPFQYLLSEVNKEGQIATSFLGDLPAGRFSCISWQLTSKGLAFTGLLSKSEKEAFQYIVSGEFNSWSKKVSITREQSLKDAPFWTNAAGEFLKSLQQRGISANVDLIKSYQLADQSTLLVMQPVNITHYVSGNRTSTSTHAGSAYIVKVSASKELDWIQAIPINQYEPTYPIFCGLLPVLKNGKELYLFCTEHSDNTAQQPDAKEKNITLGNWKSSKPSVFQVTENGQLKRLQIDSYVPDEHHMAPHWPSAFDDSTGVFTLYHHRNLGKSTYRLGLFTIN